MSDPQKTIREALEYASEMSLYSSEWRRYSKALAALKEMGQDTARLDFLEHGVITASAASDIVNESRWDKKYCGSIRGAIDAAMAAPAVPTSEQRIRWATLDPEPRP